MRVKMNLNVSTWIGSIILDNGEVTAGLKINFIQASDGDQRKNSGHHIYLLGHKFMASR